MTLTQWIIAVVIAWPVAAITVGYLWHRIRRHQRPSPSPNHPAMRDQRRVCDHGHPQTERWRGEPS